ncbi:sporulation initiation factor Spo0A C-terminal domain-containing protein [Ruminococcus sp.]|uniref:sporulation initiation factor Spo0A C-terminal domain-containing protein n=1 Tax=Ruminococcus sp. TaxID=41978 RepID=UPI0025EF3496|nr:sporulation initiation factor Spo0A C-terminal domain-containing protein [Ruminococcus sp.]
MNHLCVEKIRECRITPYSKQEEQIKEFNDERTIIASLLNQLGIPRNTAGYNYLIYIILKITKSNNINVKLTTELYPQIADELDSSVKRIERGLRYSIEAAWDRNREGIKNILGYYDDCKPYSSQFIWLLADKYRMINNKFILRF